MTRSFAQTLALSALLGALLGGPAGAQSAAVALKSDNAAGETYTRLAVTTTTTGAGVAGTAEVRLLDGSYLKSVSTTSGYLFTVENLDTTGLYYDTTQNRMAWYGSATERAYVDLDDGSLFLAGGLTVEGTTVLENTANFNGTVNLGNATTDAISFTGRVLTDINPLLNDFRDLGTSSLAWEDVYVGTSIVLGSGALKTTLSYDGPSANRAIVFPDAAGTLLLGTGHDAYVVSVVGANGITPTAATNGAVSLGLSNSSGDATSYIQNQTSGFQVADFQLSGTGEMTINNTATTLSVTNDFSASCQAILGVQSRTTATSGNFYGGLFTAAMGDLFDAGSPVTTNGVRGVSTASASNTGVVFSSGVYGQASGSGTGTVNNYGVYGIATGGSTSLNHGLYGVATGVTSSINYGVHATAGNSPTGYGGFFLCNANGEAYGLSTTATTLSLTEAVRGAQITGTSANVAYTGRAYGIETFGYGYGATTGTIYGVHATGSALTPGNSKIVYGVFGTATEGAFNYAVYGEALDVDGTSYGVFGTAEEIGVHGTANTEHGVGTGGQFVGGFIGVSGDASVSGGSSDLFAVHGRANNTSSGRVTYGVYGEATAPDTAYAVYAAGDFAASGMKSCVMRTSQGPRHLYCQESPENWLEDVGRGALVGGVATIELDPLFLETVTIDANHGMVVFVQLTGNCPEGVYVEPGTTSFTVRTHGGAERDAGFFYRVQAKRRGFETQRLEATPAGYGDPHLYPERFVWTNRGPYRQEQYEALLAQGVELELASAPPPPAGFAPEPREDGESR